MSAFLVVARIALGAWPPARIAAPPGPDSLPPSCPSGSSSPPFWSAREATRLAALSLSLLTDRRGACLLASAALSLLAAALLGPRPCPRGPLARLQSRLAASAPLLSRAMTAAVLAFVLLYGLAGVGDGSADDAAPLLVLLGGLAAGQLGMCHWPGPGGAESQPEEAAPPSGSLPRWLHRHGPVLAVGPLYLLAAATAPAGPGGPAAAAGHLLVGLLYLLMAAGAVGRARQRTLSWRVHADALRQLRQEEANNDAVLSLLLPREVMDSMKASQSSVCFAEEFRECTVLFAEIANFAAIVAASSPARTMELLNAVFWEVKKRRKKGAGPPLASGNSFPF